jgi:hypothetical protein
MTDLEAFKFGFLLRCADEGLTAEQVQARIKLAAGPAVAAAATGAGLGLAKPALGLTKNLAGLSMLLGGAGLAGAAGLGAGGGYLAAKATEPDMDAEDAKMQELIAAYRQQADQARRTASRIGYRMHSLRPRGRGISMAA